jgi:site-specific recombinase XerD
VFLFKYKDGKLLTKPRFVAAVRDALEAAGLDHKAFAGHSFRIGAATTFNACGLNDSTIQMLGRWSSLAYLVYIQTPRDQSATFSSLIGQTNTAVSSRVGK